MAESCTTKDDNYPIIYRVFIDPRWLAGFLPSTVGKSPTPCWSAKKRARNKSSSDNLIMILWTYSLTWTSIHHPLTCILLTKRIPLKTSSGRKLGEKMHLSFSTWPPKTWQATNARLHLVAEAHARITAAHPKESTKELWLSSLVVFTIFLCLCEKHPATSCLKCSQKRKFGFFRHRIFSQVDVVLSWATSPHKRFLPNKKWLWRYHLLLLTAALSQFQAMLPFSCPSTSGHGTAYGNSIRSHQV